jgi:hypothetical protein
MIMEHSQTSSARDDNAADLANLAIEQPESLIHICSSEGSNRSWTEACELRIWI